MTPTGQTTADGMAEPAEPPHLKGAGRRAQSAKDRGRAATACGWKHWRFELDEELTPWRTLCGRPSRMAECLSGRHLLMLRVVLLGFWLFVFVRTVEVTFSWGGDLRIWAAAFTHWSAALQLLYLAAACASTLMALRGRTVAPEWSEVPARRTPWFVRLTWALQSAELPATFVVFAIYWVFGWPAKPYFPQETDIGALTHGANFVVAMLDFLVAGLPVHLCHVYVPVSVGLLYGVQSSFAPADYNFLTWGDAPELVGLLIVALSVLVIPLVFAGCHGIDRCRQRGACSPSERGEVSV